jgi:polyketide cyclase/dehydrase/lipid transport protein
VKHPGALGRCDHPRERASTANALLEHRMDISASARIHRPVADVWRWYAVDHVRNHPRWDPDMTLDQVTPGPLGPGARIRRRNTRWGTPIEGEMEITEWQPERLLGTHIRDANMEIGGLATLEPVSPNETLLTITIDVPGLDAAKAAVMRERMHRTADNIKRLIESDT